MSLLERLGGPPPMASRSSRHPQGAPPLKYAQLCALDRKWPLARQAFHVTKKKLRTDAGDEFLLAFLPAINDGADPRPTPVPCRRQRLKGIRNQHTLAERRLERAPPQREQGLGAEALEAGSRGV